jgi:hypothetical protein
VGKEIGFVRVVWRRGRGGGGVGRGLEWSGGGKVKVGAREARREEKDGWNGGGMSALMRMGR